MLKARRSDRPPAAKKAIKNTKNIKSPYNFKFGFIKKYILYIFLSLFILFFAFTLLAPIFINLKVWKPEIISMLEKNTGKSASIKGDINLSIYPSPQIKIYDISLQEEQNGTKSNFLYSSSVVAKLSLWPLLKGKIVIDKVILEKLDINLINFHDQEPNWIFTKKESLPEVNNNELDKKYSKFNQIQYPNIKINEYTIKSGQINYNNNYKVSLNNIIISSNNEMNLIQGNIIIDSNNFDLNSSFIRTNNIKESWKISSYIGNKDVKINTKGDLKFDGVFPSFEGSVDINSKNIDSLSKKWNKKYLNILENKTKIFGDASLNFKDNNLFYSIYNLSINSGPFIFTGALSGNNGSIPKIKIILSSNNVDIDLLQNKLSKHNYFNRDLIEENINANTSYWDLYKGSLLLSVGTSKYLEYPVRNLVIDIKKEFKDYILNSARATFPGNTKIDIKGKFKKEFTIFEGSSILNSENIRDFCKWISIDLNNISDSRLRKTSIKSSIVFRKGGAIFAGISGVIDSSNISGEVRLRFQEKNNFYANLKIDNLNLDAYLEKNAENEIINNKDNKILNLDSLNIDLEINQALFLKNRYNKIKFNSSYKDKILQISDFKILDFAKGDLELNGNINFNNKREVYDFSIDTNHKNFSELISFYKLPNYFNSIFKDGGNISIISKGTKESLFSNIGIQTPIASYTYEGDIGIKNISSISYKGELKFELNNLYDLFNTDSNNIQEKAQYSSQISYDKNLLKIENINFKSKKYIYSGNLNLKYLNNKIIDFNTNLSSNFITIAGLYNFYDSFNLGSNIPIKGNLKINSKLFAIENYKILDFNSSLDFSEEQIILKKFQGKFLGGNLNMDGNRSNKGEKLYNANIKLSKINGSDLINHYFSYDKIDANIYSKLTLNGKSSNIDEFFNTLNANGELTLKKALIKGLDIEKFDIKVNISDELLFKNYILESFNTDQELSLENISLRYIIKNDNVILNNVSINIGEYSSLLNGEFNLKDKNYFSSIKIALDNIEENYFSINLERTENKHNIYVESDLLIEADKESNVDIDLNYEVDNSNISIEREDEKFDDILNNLSKNSIIEKIDNERALNQENNVVEQVNIDTTQVVDDLISPIIIKPKLPDYFENIKGSSYVEIKKLASIKNNLIKPKLPTQEDILDDLLDSVLYPDN